MAANRLRYYRPYAKQHEFHAAGSLPVYERLFTAGNQLGKTMAGAAEMAMHLTGRYEEYRTSDGRPWPGRRFDHAITALAGSESSELTRDGVQRLLVGPPASELEWGTGFIPKDAIVDINRKQGVPNSIDTVTVRHKSGGISTLLFKSYDQGRSKWQANTVHFVWFDEEPPFEVYDEGRTRTTATRGSIMVTFTPLLGMSQVVKRFLNELSPDRRVITMTIWDVDHLDEAEKKRIIAGYPEHMRDARALGIPMLGAGAIFPVSDSEIVVDPFRLPHHWRRIGGLDFGWDHPTAAVELAYDGDHDIIYVTREYRARQKTPVQHCLTLGQWEEIRFAWPPDGMREDGGHGGNAGRQLADQYRRTRKNPGGIKLLGEAALFEDGTRNVEPGLMMMLTRMQTGRWKVFRTCPLWMEEKRQYHRAPTNDGGSKIVKMDDDLISASRYALMCLREARIVPIPARFGRAANNQSVAEGTGEVASF